MTSLRITCVIGSLGCGGAERNIVRLSEELAKCGHRVTLMTIAQDIPDFYYISEKVARVWSMKEASNSYRWYELVGQIKRKNALKLSIVETNPDIVISFIDTTNISVLGSLSGTKIPVIVSERTDPRHHDIGWRWKLLRRLFYPKTSCVVMVANDAIDWAKSQWPRWNVEVIPNPVIMPRFLENAIRPGWFGDKNIVAMGRLQYEKGFDLLIKSFGKISPSFPEWNLIILGEGGLRKDLEREVTEEKLSGRVHLPGMIKMPFDILRQADLFVLSSRYEGFPMGLAEAMACGTAVISFDCPSGPSQIIRNGIDGLLVPPNNVQALSDAMVSLMGDENKRNSFASKAPEIVERFSVDSVIAAWESVIFKSLN